MAIQITKAVREKIWVKVLLSGASGSGKSYSALRLATGMAKACGSNVVAIDTENGRIRYYADEFDFDDIQLDEPYSPEKYIEAIDAVIDAGYKVLIIDSASHEWKYINDVHDKMPGNSFTNWGKVKPRHAMFMEKILQSPLHVFVTGRGKDDYVLEDKNGKQVPKKVGVGVQQEKDIEYNYTVTFNVDQSTHIADATKDNTHLFENRYEMLTEKDGAALYKWANSGEKAAPKPPKDTTENEEVDELLAIKAKIKAKSEELIASGVEKTKISEAVKSVCGTANFNKIDDLIIAQKTLEAVKGVA